MSNSVKVNKIIPSELKCAKAEESKNMDVLGLVWNINDDKLCLKFHEIKVSDIITKRVILSECSKLYDPLGILLPVTVASRIFMQDLWKLKIKWDERVDDGLADRWRALSLELNACQTSDIDRNLNLTNNVEIYCFCDASMKAYGAVLYVKSNNTVKFIMAKTRPAPVKSVTLPRLELLAAEVASNLVHYVKSTLSSVCDIVSVDMWSDSKIVLCWLESNKNDCYVQNRVNKVLSLTPEAEWHHVQGKANPADYLTRGISAIDFHKCKSWFEGPQWLNNRSKWPVNDNNDLVDTVAYSEIQNLYCNSM